MTHFWQFCIYHPRHSVYINPGTVYISPQAQCIYHSSICLILLYIASKFISHPNVYLTPEYISAQCVMSIVWLMFPQLIISFHLWITIINIKRRESGEILGMLAWTRNNTIKENIFGYFLFYSNWQGNNLFGRKLFFSA